LTKRAESAIFDVALWKASSGAKVVTAEDSGIVRLIDPRNSADSIVIAQGKYESALTVSVDSINKTGETLLSVGYSQAVEVLDIAKPETKK
jgi:hypothetical protein